MSLCQAPVDNYAYGLFRDPSAVDRAGLRGAALHTRGLPLGLPGLLLVFDNCIAALCALSQIVAHFPGGRDVGNRLFVSCRPEPGGAPRVYLCTNCAAELARARAHSTTEPELCIVDYGITTPLLPGVSLAALEQALTGPGGYWLGGLLSTGELLDPLIWKSHFCMLDPFDSAPEALRGTVFARPCVPSPWEGRSA